MQRPRGHERPHFEARPRKFDPRDQKVRGRRAAAKASTESHRVTRRCSDGEAADRDDHDWDHKLDKKAATARWTASLYNGLAQVVRRRHGVLLLLSALAVGAIATGGVRSFTYAEGTPDFFPQTINLGLVFKVKEEYFSTLLGLGGLSMVTCREGACVHGTCLPDLTCLCGDGWHGRRCDVFPSALPTPIPSTLPTPLPTVRPCLPRPCCRARSPPARRRRSRRRSVASAERLALRRRRADALHAVGGRVVLAGAALPSVAVAHDAPRLRPPCRSSRPARRCRRPAPDGQARHDTVVRADPQSTFDGIACADFGDDEESALIAALATTLADFGVDEDTSAPLLAPRLDGAGCCSPRARRSRRR